MRIHDLKHDRSLATLGLFFTPEEARQMIGYLQDLLDAPDDNHAH